jgi:hypothetical protein
MVSPGWSSVATPARKTSVPPISNVCGSLCLGFSAFHAARVWICSMVSKVCGLSFWPGMLSTLMPRSTTASPGAPGALSTVKARKAEAATPGLSS